MSLLLTQIAILFFTTRAEAGSCDSPYPVSGPIYSGNYADAATNNQQNFRIISYNIKFGDYLEDVIKDLERLNKRGEFDFLLLQEVTAPLNGRASDVVKIAEHFKMNYVYAPAIVREGEDYGNAILSRGPLTDFKKILLPLANPEDCNQRIALGAKTKIGNKTIQLVSLHLSTVFSDSAYDDALRTKQLKPAADYAASVNKEIPVIVAGDFNSFKVTGLNRIKDLFTSYKFIDAHPVVGWTFKRWRFDLDHIFSRGFKTTAAGNDYAGLGSDHIAIWSNISLEN